MLEQLEQASALVLVAPVLLVLADVILQ